MTRVSCIDDPRIVEYRDLANPSAISRAGLFVAEGRWVVERLLARSSGAPQYVTRSVLVTPTALAALAAPLRDVAIFVVDQDVMDQIVGFNIHRGCLALAERPPIRTLDTTPLDAARRLVVLEGVNNPDNVGGIFRSAAAFDVDLVVLGPGCGDPLYRKAIRTSMAATLDVAYVASGAWPQALATLRAAGFEVLALTPDERAEPLESVAARGRIAMLFGTEGGGLSAEALAGASRRVRIRTSGRVDSLNVTVAASIALHHFFAA